VLIPADKGNLSRLVTDANLFERLHVILALPDEEEATTRLGHLLYPRVVLHANQLVDTLEAILRKALVASPVAAPQQVPTTPPKYALCDVEDLEQTLERRRRT
jgi:hypothetical protein